MFKHDSSGSIVIGVIEGGGEDKSIFFLNFCIIYIIRAPTEILPMFFLLHFLKTEKNVLDLISYLQYLTNDPPTKSSTVSSLLGSKKCAGPAGVRSEGVGL